MTEASCWALMRFAISRRCCTTGALDRGHAAMGRPLDHAANAAAGAGANFFAGKHPIPKTHLPTEIGAR
jgi:hypothetical protein